MSGVEGDYHHTARSDEFQGLFKGGKGRFRPGDHCAVPARQVSEIEDNRFERPAAMLCHGFMPGMDECDRVEAPRFGQPAGSRFKGLLLDVERPYTSARACQLGKQQGVMAVAAGGIDNAVSRMYETLQHQVRQGNRAPQQRYVRDSDFRHGGRG
jgi:hypothetical protein